MYDASVLLRCDGCNTPLTVQLGDKGEMLSCAAVTAFGRHFCAECSVTVLGTDVYPRALRLFKGESDQTGHTWN